MAFRKLTKTHVLFRSAKPINSRNLLQLLFCGHRRRLQLPRSIFINSRSFCSNYSLPSDHNRIADELVSIFTKRLFHPDNQELSDLGPKLTTEIVETVLRGLKSWKIALTFFNWASNQDRYSHTCYTYNAMASILASARQNGPLRVLAMDLASSRCWMTPGALGYFVRCLGGQGFVEEANVLFDQVQKMGLCVPNIYSYNCLLEAISRSSSIGLMEIRLKEMRDSGLQPDKYTLTPVLQGYCNSGKFEKGLDVFNQMYERGWVDAHVFSILAVSFSKWGEVDKAFELIERMEDLNISLNEKTYCVLIHGFVKESRLSKALQLLGKMRKSGLSPDISLYGVLIGGLCKNKEFDKALELYSQMNKLGIRPDIQILTMLISSLPGEREMMQLLEESQEDLDAGAMILLLNSVLKGLVNNGSINKAYHLLWSKMGGGSSGDFEADGFFMIKECVCPNTTSFEIVIDSLCRTDKLDVALGLFRDMNQIGCKPSVIIYNSLIDCLNNSNRLEESYELLIEMKEPELKPTQFTHNSMYGCLCRREDVAGALRMVKEMRVHGHDPWIKYSTLLAKNLCKHGRAAEAYNFLSSMVQEGFLPVIIPYSATIDGFIKIGEVDRALELFRNICTREYCPDVVAYNIIINGLCKAKRVLEAEDILNEMMDKGLVPSVVTYNLLIDGWCKNGDIDQATLCFSRMVGEDREPNAITYTTLIDGLCKAGRPNDALKLWNEMEGNGCSPNRIAFMALIDGLCKCRRPDDALVYFQEMEKKEMKADTFVYVALIDAFISNSNAPLAFEILKKIIQSGNFPNSIDKNHLILREAIFKLCKDSRISSNVKNLIANGSIPTILSVSEVESKVGLEPTT